MKHSTLNTLLVAKSLFNETKDLVTSGDKHFCTAGIILLQDFIELIVLAVLDELDVDEQRNLEKKSFDELIGELKKNSVPIIKSGTIKALNKQRVISKHYGQLAEPASVVNYFNTANQFTDSILNHVIGCTLNEIFLADLLRDGREKELIREAIKLSSNGRFSDSLINIRKAFFIAYENEYSIYNWRDHDRDKPTGLGLWFALRGGSKAHYWTKNKQWIFENVRTPSDYIQINYDQLKIDCMEWGVSTVEIENLRRLTPSAIQTDQDKWHYDYEANFPANEANQENVNYCLDVVIDFLIKKQKLDSCRRWPKRENFIPTPPIYIGKPLYAKPNKSEPVIHVVQDGYYYSIDRILSGFDPNERYMYVHLYQQEENNPPVNHFWGYLFVEDGQ